MAAHIDIEALLTELELRDGYSVPYEVRPRGRSITSSLHSAVNTAIDSANAAALARVQHDPSWSTAADHADRVLVAELTKGSMEHDEVRAWFEDLGRSLQNVDAILRVRPVNIAKRPPNLDDWRQLPATPTAFLYFSSEELHLRTRLLPASVVTHTAAALVEWSRTPASALVLDRGLASWICPPPEGVHQFSQNRPVEEPQFGLWTYTRTPRRLRMARFGYDAKAVLQVLDPTIEPAERLDALMEGVQIFAPFLDYAYIRPGTVIAPSEYDLSFNAGRQVTAVEESVIQGRTLHLLDRYVPDVFVAQLLTSRHLERLPPLAMFEVREVNPHHSWVIARDPSPWLPEVEEPSPYDEDFWGPPPPIDLPSDEVLGRARAELGAIILTAEVIDENPPPGKL